MDIIYDRKGWICPICEYGISPSIKVCNCVDKEDSNHPNRIGSKGVIYGYNAKIPKRVEVKDMPKEDQRFGWVCPICNYGTSPFVSVCECQATIEVNHPSMHSGRGKQCIFEIK